MKTKPWSLLVLAILHLISPLGSLVLNALKSGRTLTQQWQYWFEIVPLSFLLIYTVVPMLAGVFIYLCRRWSYWAYLVCIATIFISNIYSYSTNMTVATFLVLIFAALTEVLVVAYFMVPSVQQVYFDPRMRWWEAAPRYNFNTEGIINGGRGFIKNLSFGGLFLTSGPELAEGDKVDAYWNYKGKELTVSGIVVYKSQGVQPGYGVRFDHTVESQRHVKALIEQLHNEGLIVTERLPGPEDSFKNWFKKLIRTGEGLFPRKKA